MSAHPYDWTVRLAESFDLSGHRMVVYRTTGFDRQYLGPDGVIRPGVEGQPPADEVVWNLPTGAAESLRDAIDGALGRRYDESLVNELRSSLDAERRRVDRLLARIDTLSPPPLNEETTP